MKNHWQVSIHQYREKDNCHYLLVMKGAAERIVDACSTIYVNGKDLPLDVDWRNRINDAYLHLGGMGERVLGKSNSTSTWVRVNS